MRYISRRIKRRVVEYILAEKLSIEEAAREYQVKPTTIIAWIAEYR